MVPDVFLNSTSSKQISSLLTFRSAWFACAPSCFASAFASLPLHPPILSHCSSPYACSDDCYVPCAPVRGLSAPRAAHVRAHTRTCACARVRVCVRVSTAERFLELLHNPRGKSGLWITTVEFGEAEMDFSPPLPHFIQSVHSMLEARARARTCTRARARIWHTRTHAQRAHGHMSVGARTCGIAHVGVNRVDAAIISPGLARARHMQTAYLRACMHWL
eukprot:6196109-Pleurochrysis_carterae.AAC.4